MTYFSLCLALAKLNDYMEEYLAETGLFILNSETLFHFLNIILHLSEVMGFMEEGGVKGTKGSTPNTVPTSSLFNITSLIATRSSWARPGLK